MGRAVPASMFALKTNLAPLGITKENQVQSDQKLHIGVVLYSTNANRVFLTLSGGGSWEQRRGAAVSAVLRASAAG